MTRFDSPTQVVILFTGAVLVSIVLIMLLNAEANNRKIVHEPEIENGNLFTSLGRGVRRLVRGWIQGNSTGESASGGNSDRARRSLKSLGGHGFDPLQHPVRHAKHKTKLVPTTTTTTTDAATPPPTTTTTTTTTTATPSVTDEVAENATTRNGSSRNVTKRRVDAHDICYNTHEVLLIITITCGVNFAFVFFVMICVRACSRSNKVEDIYVPCAGGSPTHTDDELCNYKSYSAVEDYCHSTSSYSSVQEYVNSLPQGSASSMLSLHSLYSPHLPLHPGGENRRKSKNSLHTAYSMEDLLLM